MDACHQFLTGNEKLEDLKLSYIAMEDDVCGTVARNSQCLKTLELSECKLDVQRFVNVLGASVLGGPRAIVIRNNAFQHEWAPGRYLVSILVPLLKKLHDENNSFNLFD
jgi:hypothetical protein